MRRLIYSLLALFFFIWILPLGAFIKPEHEKTACNGQRAICLCSHLMAKQASPAPFKSLLGAGQAPIQKETGVSASHHFLAVCASLNTTSSHSFFQTTEDLLPALTVVRRVDHVPRPQPSLI